MKKMILVLGILILGFGIIAASVSPVHAQSTIMNGGSVRFAPGASSQVISGRVDGNIAVRYEFYAAAGQSATITLNSDTNQAILSVRTLSGQQLMGFESRSAAFGMPLPVSGGYEILVYNPNPTATNYSFLLSIPPIAKATALPAFPAYPPSVMPGSWNYQMGGTIQFALGETMAQISSTVNAATCLRYDFYAGNDQHLLTSISSENSQVNLGLSDNTGALYVSNANRQTYFHQLLSKTTKYHLDICNPAQSASKFDLTFVLPARIRFAAGTYSMTVSGSVKANGVVSYTAFGGPARTMTVQLQSGTLQPSAFLRISGVEDGVVYLDHQTKQTSWTGYLPIKQDYLIEVVSFQAAANYTMSVSIY